MRKNIFSAICCIAFNAITMFFHTACTDNTPPAEEDFGETFFEVEPITFEGIAGEQSEEIHFVAGAPWTATFTSSNNWVEASPTYGKAGNATIRITPYSDNKSSTSRSAELMVLIDGSDAPYTVRITQKSAAQSDLEITGDINEGVMTLTADASGNQFNGSIKITSSNKWDIITENNSDWLTFTKDKEPQDGKETIIELKVSVDYNQFTETEMNGSFQLQVPGTTPITIEVHAIAKCNVYESDTKTETETERLSYEMVDTLQSGTFQLTFYVESNIAWQLNEVPGWIETTSESGIVTNREENGNILTRRKGVGLLVKEDALSAEARSATISLKDFRGEILKEIHIEFKGIGNNFLQHDFAFPSYDPNGNDFSFEAKASYIDPDNRDDYWKKIELPFYVKTSLNYTSIENAPFHLIMCNASNGRIVKEEVHWATLEMGDEANSSETNGLYKKEIYLIANDRGDTDDQNGLTKPTEMREAFIFIVPKSVTFNDLFVEGGSTLKEEYAESFSHIAQKQDHETTYILTLEGLNNGDTIYLPSEGGSVEFNILNINSEQLTPNLIRLHNNNGVWEEKSPTSAQESAIVINFERSQTSGKLNKMILTVGPNMLTEKRGFRYNINVFKGDGYSDETILTFDIMLQSN